MGIFLGLLAGQAIYQPDTPRPESFRPVQVMRPLPDGKFQEGRMGPNGRFIPVGPPRELTEKEKAMVPAELR